MNRPASVYNSLIHGLSHLSSFTMELSVSSYNCIFLMKWKSQNLTPGPCHALFIQTPYTSLRTELREFFYTEWHKWSAGDPEGLQAKSSFKRNSHQPQSLPPGWRLSLLWCWNDNPSANHIAKAVVLFCQLEFFCTQLRGGLCVLFALFWQKVHSTQKLETVKHSTNP